MPRAKSAPFLSLVLLAAATLLLPAAAPRVAPDGLQLHDGDIAWMLTAAALVLLMTPGLSFFYGGMVGYKNVVSTMLQSIVALGVVSLLWVAVGFSLTFGDSIGGLIGNPLTFLMFDGVDGAPHEALCPTIPLILFALFQLKFAIITPALITGSFAERVRFSSYLLFMVAFSLLVYAPLAHMTWHPDGLLRRLGVLDFAGGTVVHMSAGFAALAGAIVLGPREVHRRRESHLPANIPFVLLGTGMLWFGWFGFNAGSALAADALAATAFATTNTASAAAMLGWIFWDWMRGRKPSALGACIGAVVGLVAITPAAGFVSIRESLVIGLVASVVSNVAVQVRSRSSLDDTLDVFPCHGLGGVTGMLLTGVFAAGGLADGEFALFGVHVGAMLLVSLFTFSASFLLFKAIDVVLRLRVDAEQEAIGLDLSQHGESALGQPTSAYATATAGDTLPARRADRASTLRASEAV